MKKEKVILQQFKNAAKRSALFFKKCLTKLKPFKFSLAANYLVSVSSKLLVRPKTFRKRFWTLLNAWLNSFSETFILKLSRLSKIKGISLLEYVSANLFKNFSLGKLLSWRLIKTTLIFLIVVTFLFYRPLYFIIFFMLFSLEYWFFLDYIYKLIEFRKSPAYHSLRIKEIAGIASPLEAWIKICELNAFKRIYSLTLKKKLTFRSLSINALIILLNIPVRVIRLLNFFFTRKSTLKNTLIEYFYVEFEPFRNRKIEILGSKIYVNCSTRPDLVLKLKHAFPKHSAEQLVDHYKELIKLHTKFNNQYSSIASLEVPFYLGSLTIEEGRKLKAPHWSNESRQSIHGESQRSLIHATSNIPKLLSASQISGVAMLGLKKPGSANPGSIITSGQFEFRKTVDRIKFIPKWQLDFVYYEIYGLNHESIYTMFFAEKKQVYNTFLNNTSEELARELSAGYYDVVLEADKNKGVGELLDDIKQITFSW